MTQVLFPAIAMNWYGNGAWSVLVEAFFYLLFPLLPPILWRVRRAWVLWMLLGGVVLVGAFGGAAQKMEKPAYRLLAPRKPPVQTTEAAGVA
jgi:peptidoglycan/LPS O-acetylase OafA/YrhL